MELIRADRDHEVHCRDATILFLWITNVNLPKIRLNKMVRNIINQTEQNNKDHEVIKRVCCAWYFYPPKSCHDWGNG